MPFKQFIKRRRGIGTDIPTITIYRSCVANLNLSTQNRWLKDFKYIKLFYDVERNVLGLKPDNDPINGYKLMKSGRNHHSCTLSLRALLNYYKIKSEENKIFPCVWNKEKNLIEVDLNKEL